MERIEPKPKGSVLNYKICKLISVGGFSKVYLLRDLTNGQFRAGKFIAKQKTNQQMVENEYQLSANINHPFLLQTHEMIETEHFYIFVLEFYPGGELFELLKRNRHMP
jgi:serine/threonine protein kinase